MPKPGVLAYYDQNTNLLRLLKARSQQASGGIINNATGTATLFDPSGNQLAQAILTYVSQSQGEYEALFPPETPTVIGTFVTIAIELVASAVLKYRGTLQARVVSNV